MIIVDIDYPKNGCSTPCPAMRCQKCILKDSVSVFDYIVKERKQDRPDWCPIIAKTVKGPLMFDENGTICDGEGIAIGTVNNIYFEEEA